MRRRGRENCMGIGAIKPCTMDHVARKENEVILMGKEL